MILFREMKEEDVERVATLEASCFSAPWSANAFLSAIHDENAYFIVAESDGEIIGQCGYYVGYDEADISNVAVSQSYRNNGIAYDMLSRLIAYGKEHGVRAFTLEVRVGNLPAIAVYKKLGFQEAGIRPKFYQNPVEDALIMWQRERENDIC